VPVYLKLYHVKDEFIALYVGRGCLRKILLHLKIFIIFYYVTKQKRHRLD